jgi:pimeloyl-ACP methyl ester carboxylesterase
MSRGERGRRQHDSGPKLVPAGRANLPNATLLTFPDAGHGSLFQFHDSFVRQAMLFLD